MLTQIFITYDLIEMLSLTQASTLNIRSFTMMVSMKTMNPRKSK